MKNLILIFGLVVSLAVNAQSTACGYTTCVPTIPFSNTNDLQIYGAIIGTAKSTTATISGTVAVNQVTVVMASAPSSVTSGGSVASGAISILFETSGDFVGTIDGLRFLGNGFLEYPVVPSGRYPAIPYTITAGTLYIRKMTN